MASITPAGQAGRQPLAVNLLGLPHVCWNGLPLEMPRRQPRALLYYLTVYLHPVSRAQLCYLLWPDEGERHARRRLSRLLNELRRALPAADLLMVGEERIALDAAHMRADTRTFMHLYGEDADRAPTHALEAAVDLYRGDLLAGFELSNHPEFDLWLAHERRVWQRRLIERQTAGQAYAAAVVGDVFTFAQVQQVCGRSDLETMDGLDTLVAQRLLIEEPERYRFRHILVQVAVYRSLGHHRRRLLEGRKG